MPDPHSYDVPDFTVDVLRDLNWTVLMVEPNVGKECLLDAAFGQHQSTSTGRRNGPARSAYLALTLLRGGGHGQNLKIGTSTATNPP